MTKLLLLNRITPGTFGASSLVKFDISYFKKNDWIIKYIDTDWKKYLGEVSIILLWFQQQVPLEQKRLKGTILNELITHQTINDYIVLDYMEDVHHSSSLFGVTKKFYDINFSKSTKNFVLVRTENGFVKKYPNCNYFCIPFSVDQKLIPNFNSKPINKLLLTGMIYHKVYPLRYKICKLKKVYPIDILKHPSYEKLSHKLVGKKYLDHLNKYVASVATCGSNRFNYIVAKYFEIPASGALLFAYTKPIKNLLEKYGFKDGVNMISFDKTNIAERIEYILNPKNKSKINKIRLNGYNLIKRRHTHKIRFYEELHQFIENLKKK